MKNAILCWTRLKATKHLATIKQIIRKNVIFCLKNLAFFSQSKRRHRFDYLSSPVCFRWLFKEPPSTFTTNLFFECLLSECFGNLSHLSELASLMIVNLRIFMVWDCISWYYFDKEIETFPLIQTRSWL